jgi:2-hydroxy-3-keto-5-methylthiopentenyl-1-phosphate phosphatase
MIENSGWAVQCDFDGTISLQDVTDALLVRFARPGWQALEASWVAGDMGSGECMKGQVALLDMSLSELDEFLDGIAIDPHFAAFAAMAEHLGIPLVVTSDGIDHAIHRILGRHGLAHLPVRANHLVQLDERRWRLTSPHATAACERASGTCKCELLKPPASAQLDVLFVGDGQSDFCVAGKADFVLAKAKLVDHCARHGIAHARFDTFEDALPRLLEIVGCSHAVARA